MGWSPIDEAIRAEPRDQTPMISFDGGIAEPVMRQRPDRYRLLGAAVRSGLAACHYEYICLTDGDHQYEIADFAKLLKIQRYYDLIVTSVTRRSIPARASSL
jgi:hypothetical protein